jgi:glycosyltransferase involved in cell wall biosynthesis
VRVVHFGYADDLPGAARASYRLHGELRRAGVDSWMVVAAATSRNDRVMGPARWALVRTRLLTEIDARLTRLVTSGEPERSLALVGSGRIAAVAGLHPDVVQLHWLGGGLVRPSGLRRLPDVPVVWRLPDEWAFLGTAHYEVAPRSSRERAVERWAAARKARAYRHLADLTIVCPSTWLAERVAASRALGGRRIEVVATGVDIDFWTPGDRAEAAAALGLPADRPVALFGATGGAANPRKGWQQLVAALALVPDDVVLATFGGAGALPTALGARVVDLGRIDDEARLRLAYRAASAFVAPSLRENLPNTGLEALACGTPVVGFDIGGMPDLIEHAHSGWLAPPVDVGALAEGITWAVRDHAAGIAARQRAEARFDARVQARRYVELYDALTA